MDKIARFTIQTNITPGTKQMAGSHPSAFFQRAWHDVASRVEILQTGHTDLASQLSAVNEGAAFRNGDNDFSGTNIFEQPPDSPFGWMVQNVVVVSTRDTGWTAGTGAPSKGAFAAYAGQTVSASYHQAEAQATDDAAKAVSQRLLAIEQALTAHGLIGA
jgi:hypothetical protein